MSIQIVNEIHAENALLTDGEQYHAVQVNQTFTGVTIG